MRSRLNSASSELSFGPGGRDFFALRTRQLFPNGRQPQSPLVQDLGRETFLFAQQAQQQVLGPDVLVIQPLGFFRAVGQHALALMAQRQIHGSRNLFADGGVAFDLFADGLHRGVRAQKPVRERLVFAQQSQEQMFGFDIGTAELAGLVPREEDDPSRLLRISLKHRM